MLVSLAMPALLSSLLPTALAMPVLVDDTLATGASADEIRGGTFTGSGWRVDDSNSRMYWDLGAAMESGDISVTIDDISWDNLLNANNHLIELFSDGGHSSDNRAINFRLYGYGDSDEYGEWGDLKLLGWDRITDPSTDLVAEERYYGLDWDGLPHTWRITWDPTDFVLYRDGAELIHMDCTGTNLSVRYLWLPLQDWGGGYSAPIGTLYSNLHVEGIELGGGVDTGGTDTGGTDTGLPDDGNASTFSPVEDVTAANWESGVYPAPEDLAVEGDGASNTAQAWVKFDLSAVTDTITSARLILHARSSSDADGDGGSLYTGTDNSWSEGTMTWSNKPALGPVIGSYPHVDPSGTYEFDVSAYVQSGQIVSFAVASTGSNGTHFSSKEDDGGSAAPSLVITTVADTGGGDNGGNGGDTGDDDAVDTGSAATDDTGSGQQSGGCACSAGDADRLGVGSRGAVTAGLLGLAGLLRRRGRSTPGR